MWLRVLSGADAGRTVEVPEDRPFILGRVQGCDLVIRDERASRQHAELRAEPAGGVRVVDFGSANGTFVAPATGPLPSDPIPVRGKHELAADDRIYVGAWTRIVIRRATDDEKATLA